MFPPFDEAAAYEHCKRIIALLDAGALSLESTSRRTSEERGGAGIMVGALVALDGAGAEKVLYTVSGVSRRIRGGYPGATYVEPIVSARALEASLSENDARIHSLTDEISRADAWRAPALRAERERLTDASWARVMSLYAFHSADGRVRSLRKICGDALPPAGTGDCCAPKLLDFAFRAALRPVSMCEVYYGKPSAGRAPGVPCPPCDARCALILPAMLGLDIVYRDRDIIVVNKPAGLLSVPGRGADKQDSVVSRVRRLFPACIDYPAVHRLDMETSGLMVLAFTKDAQRALCSAFERGEVEKCYVALVDGVLPKAGVPSEGTKTLFFRLDPEHRPRQVWDSARGKKAVTDWKVLDVEKYEAGGRRRDVTRVLFTPHTGRTHQLRVLCADPHGFGVPIAGDALYGSRGEGERLALHACYLRFAHPATGERMEFKSESAF